MPISESKSLTTFDLAIIGGGILGLATAREFLRRDPSARVVVLEKEAEIASQQTGRNSGVIHSGIYYTPGSAKARFCVSGALAMVEYCEDHAIPYARPGKLIVASQEEEVPRLQELRRRAVANGVEDVVVLDQAAIRDCEPHVRGIAALHVPSTAVVDFRVVARTLAAEVSTAGAEIRLGRKALAIRADPAQVTVTTSSETIACGQLIACAGIGSDQIARQIGGSDAIRIVPFRGDYYRLAPARRDLIRGLVYPVPDPRFPFLGVHFTPRIDGDVWLGPNAVLALGAEAYRRRDIHLKEAFGFVSYAGFRKMAARYWRTGVAEIARDYSKRMFLGALRRYVPDLQEPDLLPGPSGIRAQAIDSNGKMVDDFWFETLPRVLVVRNAPSPAATASLVLAREIVDRAQAASI
jgi:L-2-hydroxyglutarate oxidase LhgO